MRRIIMDVDTGTDDAIAIFAAVHSDAIELVAVGTVHGNASVENTTQNTLKVLHAAGADEIPVYPGAAEPMVKNLTPARALPVEEPVLAGYAVIDGKKVSMNPDELDLPEPTRRPEQMKAALFYLDYLRRAEQKITIVATGALTNLALALRMDPSIADAIEELVIMGGGINKANITAAAEANFYKDPEAAAIVLRCGAPIVLCALDATHSCSLTAEHEAKLRQIGNAAAEFTANDIRARRESYAHFQPLERANTAPIHDALCIAYLIDPAVILDLRDATCDVDCSDGISEGRLQMDPRHFRGKSNVQLALRADPDRMCDILAEAFSGKR